ncbi:hypothetical protein [Paenibacillus sp. YIM B09110]|uniref:hypothetical protein n=1 Tax=Paenibacillus sp. YIM B09110 TaxID=3126102 RepID=UPI00301D32B4
MNYELTIEQRDAIMARLTEEQRQFIHHELVRGRRTLFARQLARVKCQFIPEDAEFEEIKAFIEEWDYQGFTDSGEVSPETKCECGRSLRYQHKVLHVPSNTIRYFGIEHLQLHTGIDAKAVADIMKGFDVLDGEMNEVLSKYRDGWQLGQHLFLPLPEELDMPPDIQAQIDADLPLLGRQLARIRRRLSELETVNRKKRLAAAMSYVDVQPPPAADGFPNDDDLVPPMGNDAEQAAFSFEDADNGQAAFVFDETFGSQGAFVFEEEKAERPADPRQDAFDFEEAGWQLGAALLREQESGSSSAKRSSPFYLPPAAQSVVDNALQYGRISTLAISNFLIEQKLVQDTRMSTGKPAIYIAVAAYMDKLAGMGQCELVFGNAEDRSYMKK